MRKSTATYMKKLLESQKREQRLEARDTRLKQDFDIEQRYSEPKHMPAWARAIRAADNDIRSV
jgi:hypothetical protein